MAKKVLTPAYLEYRTANMYFIPHFTDPGRFVYFKEEAKDGKRVGSWVEVDVFAKKDMPAAIPEAPAAEDHIPFPAPLSAEAMGACRFLYFNEKTSTVYFTAKGKEIHTNPEHEYVYSMKTDTQEAVLISKKKGHHQVYFSPDGSFFLDTISQADEPSETIAYDPEGNPIVNICSCDISLLEDRLTFPIGTRREDGTLDAMIFMPKSFDPSKKFPVAVHSVMPPRSFAEMMTSDRLYQAMAECGWISVITPEGMDKVLKIEEKYAFMDKDRTFIFGEGETAPVIEGIRSSEM